MKSIPALGALGIALVPQQAPPGDILRLRKWNGRKSASGLHQPVPGRHGDDGNPGTDYDPKNNPDFPVSLGHPGAVGSVPWLPTEIN